MSRKPLRVEVHALESWVNHEWAQCALDGANHFLEVVPPDFSPDTDIFLFYEEAITIPSWYTRVPYEKRFGLLLEPSTISPSVALSLCYASDFRRIFTHDPFLLAASPIYRKNFYGSSVAFRDADLLGAPEKTAAISMITSNMGTTAGHRFRLKLAGQLHRRKSPVAIFGRNIPWGPYIPDRRDGVAPFLFSIVVENSRKTNYFSEKLVDCFVTRTVPLYWGCPNITEFFDPAGMLFFDDEKSFWVVYDRIMADPQGVYESCREGLEENFRRCLESYNVPHVWGSVAKLLLQEVDGPWIDPQTGWSERLRLYLYGRSYQVREHCFRIGTTPFVPRKFRRAVGRILNLSR